MVLKSNNALVVGTCFVLVVFLFVVAYFGHSFFTGNVILGNYLTTAYAPPYNVFDGNRTIFGVYPDNLVSGGAMNESDFYNFSLNVSLSGGYIYIGEVMFITLEIKSGKFLILSSLP
jgi:hypothetical protein